MTTSRRHRHWSIWLQSVAMLDIINTNSLSWSYPIGRKASRSWWRLRWVLLPPRRLPAVIPLPLQAVLHCPTVCLLLSCYLSPLTSSSLDNTQVLTSHSIFQAQNQFLPHSVLSLVLWLWNRWCTGFYQQVFFFPACFPVKEVWSAHSIYCGVFSCLFTSPYHMNHTASCQCWWLIFLSPPGQQYIFTVVTSHMTLNHLQFFDVNNNEFAYLNVLWSKE